MTADAAGRAHLAALAARPRPTGSPAAEVARRYCARALETLGYGVVERPFSYSAFPGRLATPIAGVCGGATVAAAAALAGAHHPLRAATVASIAAVALAAAGVWIARRGVLALPLLRARGVNLEATRGNDEPRVWLVAHVDSKSQLVPMSGRVTGVIALGAGWLATIALAWAAVLGAALPRWVWLAAAAVGASGAVLVALTLVGDRSPGAVDNASGLAAVLAAAGELPPDAPVGILVTDAEELGMAGARAWVRGREGAAAVNCDGVDDAGTVRAMYSGRAPRRALAAATRAGEALGEPVDVRRLLPGVLLDGVALADAGWEVVTLMRGTAATLRRVHTAHDDLAHLRGDGIAIVARLLARTALELC